MKRMMQLAGRRLEGAFSKLAGGILLILACAGLFVYATISMNGKEEVSFHRNGLLFWAALALVAAAVLFVMKRGFGFRSRNGMLFALGSLAWIAVGTWLICSIDPIYVRTDVEMCHKVAAQFLEGDYGRFFYGYIDKNPHQLGLVSMILLLYTISRSTAFFQAVYLSMILLINFFVWKCSELTFGKDHPVQPLVIILSFLFLPLLFYMLFLYNNIPGLCFLMAAVYCLLKYRKGGSVWFAAVAVCALSAACIVRTNVLIAAIALTGLCALWFFQNPKAGTLVLALCLMLCPVLSQNLLRQHYRNVTGAELKGGTPALGYVYMGIEESPSGNGWFTSYCEKVYQQEQDPQRASAIIKQDIRRRLGEMHDPLYTLDFFAKKLASTWLEPTYQSIWSGPGVENGAECKNGVLMSLYGGGKANKLFGFAAQIMMIGLYLLAGLYPFWKGRMEDGRIHSYAVFALVHFLGGFLFHLFWETKSQYVFGYVVVLIPLAAYTLYAMATRLAQKRAEVKA